MNRHNLAVALLILPNLIGMAMFVFVPIVLSFIISFFKWDLLGAPKWEGLGNYSRALLDPAIQNSFSNTLLFIGLYLPSVLCIGLCLALLFNRKFFGRDLFRAAYFVPVVTSWVAVSIVWKWLLNPQFGVINFFLATVGLNGPAWLFDPQWAMVGVVLTSVWKDSGFIMILYLAGLQDIPGEMIEASELDGANKVQTFFYVVWPMLARTTFFVVTISLINSFQVFDQVWIMTQGGPAGSTSVVVEQIYKNAFSFFQMGYASAISWLLFAIILFVTLAQQYFQKRVSRVGGL
jgi:multiple sugar transport system permease protein